MADRAAIKAALERRIERQEIAAANFGLETPPHILEDLDQARRDLAALEVVDRPAVSQEVIDVIPAAERAKATFGAILLLNQQLAELQQALDQTQAQLVAYQERTEHQLLEYQARDYQERIERQRDTDRYRVEMEQRLGNVRAAILALAVATVLGWLFRRRP
jgi:hypothetical protein